MQRQHLYFTIFILGILIWSSLYLSWSVDRGMGQVVVQRISLEREPGRPVDILVYQPRDEALGGLLEPTPIILSIHGIAGSKEGMYPFNIELARRNFTVVAVDLPGHGDSTLPFDITDFDAMAEDAYFALRHVQNNFTNVHNETYGVVAHSFGVQVGLHLTDFPIAPVAFAAVGDIGQMALSQYDLPSNLTVEAGIDASVVSETTTGLIETIQGSAQLAITRDPNSQIFFSKTIATFTGSMFLLISIIPIMMLVYDLLSERLKPRRIPLETKSLSLAKTFFLSSLMGAISVFLFAYIISRAPVFGTGGIGWLNPWFWIEFIFSYFIGFGALLTSMRIILGIDQDQQSLTSIIVERAEIRNHVIDIVKSLIIIVIPIIWIMIWLAIAGLPDSASPYIFMLYLKWPVDIKTLNVFLLALLSLPLLVIEAAWVRGLLLRKREWGKLGSYHLSEVSEISFALVARLAVSSVCVFIVASVLSWLSGMHLLLSLVLIVIAIVQILTTSLIVFTSLKFENTWPAVILGAFLLALVIITIMPLI